LTAPEIFIGNANHFWCGGESVTKLGCGRKAGAYTPRLFRREGKSVAAAVAIIMGSRSDWPTLKKAAEALDELGVAYEPKVVSAHRTPERLYAFARGAAGAGFKVIIAGAGGAAHLPGMTASLTTLPVLGVPVRSKTLDGLDSLLSIVQMPAGVPVGGMAVGEAGARNAGLMAARILALSDPALSQRLATFHDAQSAAVPEQVED
jgi:5-(carboxyamino)imidazole ribonucleotide mutase